ncbi:MAG TPA: hypothetical protein VJ892_01635, partial [Candidatus Absconditabacterales bacterium]|nr:hypothetical protein [Candidatus Absconditabacterales bacterium]
QIISEVKSAIENNSYQKQMDLAKEILENNNPYETVAALLELKYENELCSTKYRKISDAKPSRGGNRRSNYRGGNNRSSGGGYNKNRGNYKRSSKSNNSGKRNNTSKNKKKY